MSGLEQNIRAAVAALFCGVLRLLDVVLHLGAHRTGTTSFQAYLHKNRNNLRQTCTEFWGPGHTRSKLFCGLFRNPVDLDGPARCQGQRSLENIETELSRLQQRGAKSLIVSEENMIGVMKDNLMRASLYPDASARLGLLAQGFGSRCRRVVVSIRSYESYWASVLAFTLTRGWPVPDKGELALLAHQPRRWRDLVSDVAAVFPGAEIIVWPFEGFAGQAPRQLAMLGGNCCAVPVAHASQWCNASANCTQLRQHLARRGDFADAARLPDRQIRWQPFSRTQITAFQKQYAEDIAWLRAGADGLATFYENPDSEQTKIHSWALSGKRGHINDQKTRRAG